MSHVGDSVDDHLPCAYIHIMMVKQNAQAEMLLRPKSDMFPCSLLHEIHSQLAILYYTTTSYQHT